MDPANASFPNSTTNGTIDGGANYVIPIGAEAFFRNFIYGTLCAMAALLIAVTIIQFVGGNFRECCNLFSRSFYFDERTDPNSRSRQRRPRRANEQHIVDDRGRIIQVEEEEDNQNDDDDFESDGYSINMTSKYADGSGRWNRTHRNLTDRPT